MHESSRKSAKVSSGERRYVDSRKGLISGLCIETACWRLVRKERKKKKKKKKKYHSLIFKVWNWKNLNEAWEKVKQNREAAGADEVSIAEFERNLEMVIQKLNPIVTAKCF